MKKYPVLALVLICMVILVSCANSPEYDTTPIESAPNETVTSISEEQETPIETVDRIPMVMINGILYLDTGCESAVEARCGVMDGEITSTVDGSETPTEDNQSNFGTGYGYQYGPTEGTIEIYMNEKWWVFATEEARQEIQFPEP